MGVGSNFTSLASVDPGALENSRSEITFSYNGQYPDAIDPSTGLTIANNHNEEEATYTEYSFYEITNANYIDGGIDLSQTYPFEAIFDDLDKNTYYGNKRNWIGIWGGRQAYYAASVLAQAKMTINPTTPITGHEVWSGSVNITTNTTINSGASVTIIPGTNVTSSSGFSLINNGTLSAVGVSSNRITFDFVSKQNNNGIKVNSGATANIYYSNILNAINGIYFNSGTGIADHCTITNCTYGIYVTSATPTIQYCSINNNQYGIRIFNSYSQSWTANNIAHNSITGNIAYGVYLNNSSPTLSYNSVSSNYLGSAFWTSSNPILNHNNFSSNTNYGVSCYGSASPSAYYNPGYSFGGYNNIISNGNRGIVVTGTSHPYWGSPSLSSGGYNSVYNNTGYEIDNSAPNFDACNNWWGNPSGPQTGDINGTVRTFPALDYDPNPYKANYYPEELHEAEHEMITNNYVKATDLLKTYLTEHTDNNSYGNVAAVLLLKNLDFYMDGKSIVKEIESCLENKLSRDGQFELLLGLSSVLSKDKNYTEALESLEQLVSLTPTINENNRILFQKAFINLYGTKDVDKCLQYLNQILNRNLSTSLDYRLALEEINTLSSSEGLTPELSKNITNTNLPKAFDLLGNYPNPFNPSTTISYALPYQSSVDLIIYDIMGREVKSFKISSQSAGNQNIRWDGTNENGNTVSSGIYLYRINIKSLENTETFVKTAKLIMLK